MKHIYFIPLIISIYLSVMIWIYWHFHYTHVEQVVSSEYLVTYVWVDNRIAKSWYDPMSKVDSAFAARRRVQAENYIKLIETITK